MPTTEPDDDTPKLRRRRRSLESEELFNAFLLLNALAVDVEQAAERLDELAPADRVAVFPLLENRLGAVADGLHELRALFKR